MSKKKYTDHNAKQFKKINQKEKIMQQTKFHCIKVYQIDDVLVCLTHVSLQ